MTVLRNYFVVWRYIQGSFLVIDFKYSIVQQWREFVTIKMSKLLKSCNILILEVFQVFQTLILIFWGADIQSPVESCLYPHFLLYQYCLKKIFHRKNGRNHHHCVFLPFLASTLWSERYPMAILEGSRAPVETQCFCTFKGILGDESLSVLG